MSDINRPPIQRANYFRGQTLQTDDFVCEQQYNMELRTLLNSSLHTWGIASGLTVGKLIAEGAGNESTGGVLLRALRGPNGAAD